VLEALRAEQHVDLEVLQENALDAPATQDSSHVHGQLYGRIRWRDGAAGARPTGDPPALVSGSRRVPPTSLQ
jgi:hypothetical protein